LVVSFLSCQLMKDEEGQRLFQPCKPLFSHVPVRGSGRMPKASHTTRSDGQPVNERTIQDPDPKAGRTPGSPSTMTRGRRCSAAGGERGRHYRVDLRPAPRLALWSSRKRADVAEVAADLSTGVTMSFNRAAAARRRRSRCRSRRCRRIRRSRQPAPAWRTVPRRGSRPHRRSPRRER
jgi:hypothetical protein